jgi:uncharacterized RDD family membrane protein YckC
VVSDPFDVDPLIVDEPAPLGRRALALGVDLATVGTWVWALSITHIAFWLQWSDERAFGPWNEYFLATLTFVVSLVIYETVFISRSGATPGQDLMRIRVVDADAGTDAAPRFGSSLVRGLLVGGVWMFPWVWPGVVLTLLMGLSSLTDPYRRGFHDHLSGMIVILRLVPTLEPGQTVEEAENERRRQFLPRMVNPIQITPMQMFRHPFLNKPDDEPDPS